MPYALIRGNEHVADFRANPRITQFGIEYRKGAVRKDSITLLMEQLAHDKSRAVRNFITDNYSASDIVCANALINNPESEGGPIFVERPAGFVQDKKTDLWKIKEGENTKLYTKADGFEMPKQTGWYVPVPTGDGTSKLMLYHPLTGMPLETTQNRDKAEKRLAPYLMQVRGINERVAKELASDEISRLWKHHILCGDIRPILRVCDAQYNGSRYIICTKDLDDSDADVGVRLFTPVKT